MQNSTLLQHTLLTVLFIAAIVGLLGWGGLAWR